MATKKFLELQNMAADAINAELKQASADLVRMKFDHGSKGLQNPINLSKPMNTCDEQPQGNVSKVFN